MTSKFEKYKELYEERAAIREHEGKQSGAEAEKNAYAEIRRQILEQENVREPQTYGLLIRFERELKPKN